MKRGILLSGGMDSVALAYWQRPDFAYTIDYGQVAAAGELRSARTVAAELAIVHRIISIDCRSIGSGDMAGCDASVHAPASEWWPFRNQLLLTLAASRAIEDKVTELIFGAVKTDNRHADGRPDFFERVSALFGVQEGALNVTAPAIGMDSEELIRTSKIPSSLLAWSHSCHVSTHACGDCWGCRKHMNVMHALGYDDY